MWQYNHTNELYHHGILGMKWGRRKASNSVSSGKSSAHISEDYTQAREIKKKSLKEMSNSDLKQLNARLQLERQYKDLKKTDISAGQQIAIKILTEVGTELAKNALKSAIKDASKAIKK